MFRLLILSVLLFTGVLISGQKSADSCQITLNIKGIKDTTVYLANYYGNKILKID